jgi:hypothetical protein
MEFEISIAVYCHDLINPPARDRNCDINLDITNPALIEFKREKPTNAATRYLLRIPQAESTGFTSYEQQTVSHQIDNLILAFNLVLERVCMTDRSSEFYSHSITPKKRLQSYNVTRTNNKVFVNIVDEHIAVSRRRSRHRYSLG